mgnify:CR=1 FL=1
MGSSVYNGPGGEDVWLTDVLNVGVRPERLIACARARFEAAGGVVFERAPLASPVGADPSAWRARLDLATRDPRGAARAYAWEGSRPRASAWMRRRRPMRRRALRRRLRASTATTTPKKKGKLSTCTLSPDAVGEALRRVFVELDELYKATVRDTFALGFGSVARVGSCGLAVVLQPAADSDAPGGGGVSIVCGNAGG